MTVWLLVACLVLVPVVTQASPCARVAFLAPSCPPEEQEPVTEPQPSQPLFPKETVARDTPPLMLELLEHPSEDTARAYLAWQAQRTARMLEVQRLLDRVRATQGEK